MDDHRPDSVVQKVQDPAHEDSKRQGAVALLQVGAAVALPRGGDSDLDVPPAVREAGHLCCGAVSQCQEDGARDCVVLRAGGRVALLGAQAVPLRCFL